MHFRVVAWSAPARGLVRSQLTSRNPKLGRGGPGWQRNNPSFHSTFAFTFAFGEVPTGDTFQQMPRSLFGTFSRPRKYALHNGQAPKERFRHASRKTSPYHIPFGDIPTGDTFPQTSTKKEKAILSGKFSTDLEKTAPFIRLYGRNTGATHRIRPYPDQEEVP